MEFAPILYLILTMAVGIAMIQLAPFNLPRWVKVICGPALGIVIVTELTLFTGLIFHYSLFSIFSSLGILVAGLVIIKYSSKYGSMRSEKLSLRAKDIKEHWPLIFLFATLGSFVTYIFATKLLSPGGYGLTTGGGGLWADTAMHAAFTMSMVAQGLPVQNPLFAGVPLVYPFLVNLFAANIVLLGGSLRLAFVLPQLVTFYAVLTLMYWIGHETVGKRATFFAVLIFFFGWGLGFVQYVQNVQKTHNFAVTEEYTHDYKNLQMHNVLTGIIFPERSMLPGLFIGLLIATFFMSKVQITKPQSLLVGFLFGILPLWHTHTFIFMGVALIVWYLGKIINFRSLSKKLKIDILQTAITTGVIAAIFAVPVLYWFFHQISHTSFISYMPGWIDHKNQIVFWFWNTGLVIPLAIIGWLFIKPNSSTYNLKPRTCHITFFLPAFLVFILANLVQFQPWDWDNIKLFSWAFFFLSLLAGLALSSLSRKKFVGIPLTLIILLSLTASGALSLIAFYPQSNTIYDTAGIEMAEWVKANTKPADVFLVEPWVNQPIPGLTGRSVYMGYPGQLWVHGLSYGAREQQVNKILAGDTRLLSQTDVAINYIVVENSKAALLKSLQKVYQNQTYTILKVH